MNKKIWTSALLSAALLLTACSGDDDASSPADVFTKASVTLLVTPNGVGDNGYNDCIVDGLFRFHELAGTPVSLLQPGDSAEAVQMYRDWLSAHAEADSAVLVVGSSSYEQMVQATPPQLAGDGSRVLLMESTLRLDGVSTLMVNRYGVSYWAGAMLHDCPVLVYAAAPNIPVLEPAIRGFLDGHDCQLPHLGSDTIALTRYLTDGEGGFANAEAAYDFTYKLMSTSYDMPDVSIFPLLGGSGAGVIRAFNDFRMTKGIVVGMDADQAALSQYIPFSVVTRMDLVLLGYLNDWHAGRDWPQTRLLGLADGATDIVLSTTYRHPFASFVNTKTKDAQQIKERYDLYRQEALRKEAAYED